MSLDPRDDPSVADYRATSPYEWGGLLYSFVTVWKDLEMTCQRPSVLSRVR